MPASTRNPHSKLFDDVRRVFRLHHYSMHTERSSVECIVRCVRFHGLRSREDLFPARNLSVDPSAGGTRRHHVDPSVIHDASKVAVRFRHAFAIHLLQRGTDLRTIQPWLGHNDRATTMTDTHILQPGGQGVPSPLDDLGV